MNELITAIKVLLANTTVMYYKTHQFHWNVEGIEFYQYHIFFESIYTDVYAAIDPTAEQLRKLGEYTAVSVDELYKYKTIEEETERKIILSDILASLIAANDQMLNSLNNVFDLANINKEQGICNFVADRIDTHKKHGWFLRASAKKIG